MWSSDYEPLNYEENDLQSIHVDRIFKLMGCNTNLIVYGKSGSGKNICVRNSLYKYLDIEDAFIKKMEYIIPNDHKSIVNFSIGESQKHIELYMENFGSIDKLFIQHYLKQKINTMFLSSSMQLTYKYVILYNIDLLSNAAQNMIQILADRYSKSSKFILTSRIFTINNNIKSKFINYSIPLVEHVKLQKFLQSICDEKQINMTSQELSNIIKINNNNIQKCINKLQMIKICNKYTSIFDEIVINLSNHIVNKHNFSLIRDLFYKSIVLHFNTSDMLKRLMSNLFENIDSTHWHIIIHIFATTEHNIKISEREIFHLEYLVYRIWQII